MIEHIPLETSTPTAYELAEQARQNRVKQFEALESDLYRVGKEAEDRGLVQGDDRFFGVAKVENTEDGPRYTVISAPRAVHGSGHRQESVVVRVLDEKDLASASTLGVDTDRVPRQQFDERGGEIISGGAVASSDIDRSKAVLTEVLGEDSQKTNMNGEPVVTANTLNKLDEVAADATHYVVSSPNLALTMEPIGPLIAPEGPQDLPSAA